MNAIAEEVGEEVLSRALHEAADEIRGRSSRRWALYLIAALLGVAIATAVVKYRSHRLATDAVRPATR
jgi:hypothetical protein